MSDKVSELDKRNISFKLSFNEMKCLLFKLRNYQYSSTEGQISVALYESLKDHLERKAKQGKLPMEITQQLLSESEDDSEQQQ